jgi:monoamine oxidase
MSRSLYSFMAGSLRQAVSPAERRARIAKLVASYEAKAAKPPGPCLAPASRFSAAVVGGGLGGLSAALTLAQQGMEVTLFEARPQVGGRVQSTSGFSTGRVIELGAELVGANHPMWHSLALRYGLSLIGRGDEELMAKAGLQPRVMLDGSIVPAGELDTLGKELRQKVLMPLGKLAKTIANPSQPWQQKVLQPLDGINVATVLEKWYGVKPKSRLWQLVEMLLVNNNVAPLNDLNLLGLLCLIKAGRFTDSDTDLMGYWDELEVFRCANGCGELARHMLEEFRGPRQGRVHLQAEVTEIDLSGRPRLVWRDVDVKGKPIIGAARALDVDYVVLAIPPSVWSGIRFTPEKHNPVKAVGLMRMGPAVKFFSDLDRRFWIDKRHAPLGGAAGVGQVWEGTDNQMLAPGQRVVLNVFAGGAVPAQNKMESGLETLYPGYGRHVGRKLRVDWPTIPFIRTGYSSPGKNQIFTVGQALNQPFAGRLCFAGEHTSMGYFGYMEGALESGARAARQILELACKARPHVPAPSPAPKPEPPRLAELPDAASAEAPAASRDPLELQRAAAKIDAGLREAATLLPRLPDTPTRALLRFVLSLLQAQFFPRGHGLIDAQGKVLKTARRGRIETQVERADGSRWPFDHGMRVWLSARRPDDARVAGRHSAAGISSVVTLYTQDLGTLSNSSAAALVVHEFVHLLLAMVRQLRKSQGDDAARRFLAREPWQRLDARRFKAHQQALAAALGPLQRLLTMQAGADELADSLVGEAMAYTLGQWLASAMDAAAASRRGGPKLTWTSVSITDLLVRQYVLERSPQFAASLGTPALRDAVARIKPPLDVLVDAVRAHWAAVPVQHLALEAAAVP